jgi:hypothetical protein
MLGDIISTLYWSEVTPQSLNTHRLSTNPVVSDVEESNVDSADRGEYKAVSEDVGNGRVSLAE